jgi:response regulator RpfG family c-di-GMP phosphodiesterase
MTRFAHPPMKRDSMRVPNPSPRPLSILVVDDYADAASSLAMVLAIEGFAPRTAGSGAEALALLIAEYSDVVVLEPRTVGCGWEVAGRMTDSATDRRPFLVAYTTDTSPAGRRAAQGAGVSSYLIKPEDPTVLVGLLRQYQQSTGGGSPAVAIPAGNPDTAFHDSLTSSAPELASLLVSR